MWKKKLIEREREREECRARRAKPINADLVSACCVIFSSLWVEALVSKDTLSPGKKILTLLTIYGSDMNLSYLTQPSFKEIHAL